MLTHFETWIMVTFAKHGTLLVPTGCDELDQMDATASKHPHCLGSTGRSTKVFDLTGSTIEWINKSFGSEGKPSIWWVFQRGAKSSQGCEIRSGMMFISPAKWVRDGPTSMTDGALQTNATNLPIRS